MKVYIDVVIGINFLFDFFLLESVNYILRRNSKVTKLLLGSLCGSITTLFMFFEFNQFQLLILKILVSVIMLIVAFGYQNFVYFKKNCLYFYLVSMLLGGAIYFLKTQFSYTNKGLIFNKSALSISYIIILIIGVIIYLKYVKSFKELKNNYSNYYECQIFLDDQKKYSFTAFLDTGNKLSDPYTNKSIVLVDKNKIGDLRIRSPMYVPYNSLNNHGLLECYKALRIVINGKECNNFLIGVSEENFFIDGIDCIINCKIMEDLR